MDLGMIGPALAVGLASAGSAIGCGIAGLASHGMMSHTDEGHGKFIAMAATPSSQCIYGIILMILMQRAILAGTLSPESAIGVGLGAGFAILLSAVFQGKVAAAGIQATARQPSVFGKCFAAIGIIESFALFAFIAAVLLL